MENFGRKRKNPLITMEQLRSKLDYDPATGVFTWKHGEGKRWRGIRVGAEAGSARDKRGYRYIRLDGEEYPAQRLAWFYMTGEWPAGILRFSDGNVSNCAFDNLRDSAVTPPLGAEHDWRTKEGKAAQQRAHRAVNINRFRDDRLRKEFGISLDRYNEMHAAQDGKCAICGNPETIKRNGKTRWLAADHCHDTGTVRALLCGTCNPMIGYAKDNIDVLEKAIEYLKSHQSDDCAMYAMSEVNGMVSLN